MFGLDVQVEIALLGLIQAIAVAVIGVISVRNINQRKKLADREFEYQKEINERVEKRAKLRAEESRLSMEMMIATLNLSEAIAIAERDNKQNDIITSALNGAVKTRENYTQFVNKVVSDHIAKN